jgi:uncharacterized delta-60 repeat protein
VRPRLRLLAGVAAASLAMATAAASASAAPGDLDPAFGGGDGLASATFDDDAGAWAVTVQPNGKIVVAGGVEDFDLARFNADGTPDTGFSGDGKLTTDFGYDGKYEEGAYAVAVQPNGKIVAAGRAGPFFGLARYNADGTPDTSFGGGDGKVTTDFPETDFDKAHALVLQPDGKIVAAGVAWPDTDSPDSIALARYEEDGELDAGFGEDETGLVVTSFPPKSEGDVANALLRRPNGKLVAVGTVHDYPNGIGKGNVGLVQYNAEGSLDTGFGGGDGMVSEHSVTQGVSAALAPNGQIAVAGGWESFRTDRFNADGSHDDGYDGSGALFPGWHAEALLAYGVAVQKDGRAIAVGTIQDGVTSDVNYAVVRYDAADGSNDASFGEDGMVTTSFEGSKNGARAVALQPDGKIVVAGGAPGGFGVIRYEGGPLPPPGPEPPAEESSPPGMESGPPAPVDTAQPPKHAHKKRHAHRRCGRAKHKGAKGKKAKRKCKKHRHRQHR